MKKSITLSLWFFCCLFMTFVYGQEGALEGRVMDCLDNSVPEGALNLTDYILQYEQLLIEREVLKDATGLSYQNLLIELFSESGETNLLDKLPSASFLTFAEPLLSKMSDSGDASKCQFDFKEDPAYKGSRLARLEAAGNSFRNLNDDPDAVLNTLLEILTPEAFDEVYYKLSIFTILEAMTLSMDEGISRKLPSIEDVDDPPIYTQEQILKISLDDNDVLRIEEQVAELEDLKDSVKQHLMQLKEEAIISLMNARATSYKAYIAVQNTITDAYNELWAYAAMEKYGKDLEELTKEELAAIKLIYPIRVSEAPYKD